LHGGVRPQGGTRAAFVASDRRFGEAGAQTPEPRARLRRLTYGFVGKRGRVWGAALV
jgi:hypothetical protein